MVPTALHRHGDVFRVFFCGRDAHNRSLIGYVDVEIGKTVKVVGYSDKVVLGLGELGCFDDSGVTPSWLVNYQGRLYLYYIGWNPRSSVRMALCAGLAVSDDGGDSFKRVRMVPVLDRTDKEPFLINTAPCVHIENGVWRLWYVSCTGWENPDLPRYNIKYAESKDGINWDRQGLVCIDFKENENALARPCVVIEKGMYKMWYSYKGQEYRIGYAESVDGIKWIRKDDLAGIDVSADGWDSQMIEYAFVFCHGRKQHMFYNGNGYGQDGIGYAVREIS